MAKRVIIRMVDNMKVRAATEESAPGYYDLSNVEKTGTEGEWFVAQCNDGTVLRVRECYILSIREEAA